MKDAFANADECCIQYDLYERGRAVEVRHIKNPYPQTARVAMAVISVSTVSSSSAGQAKYKVSDVRQNYLVAATLEQDLLKLQFADKTFSLTINDLLEQLGMPRDRIDWATLTTSPSGESMIVKGIKGDLVPFDSSTLRYLVDERYASEMDAKLVRLQFTDEELENLALSEPPPGFLEQADVVDLTRDSWK
jgi:hypothetical protein